MTSLSSQIALCRAVHFFLSFEIFFLPTFPSPCPAVDDPFRTGQVGLGSLLSSSIFLPPGNSAAVVSALLDITDLI